MTSIFYFLGALFRCGRTWGLAPTCSKQLSSCHIWNFNPWWCPCHVNQQKPLSCEPTKAYASDSLKCCMLRSWQLDVQVLVWAKCWNPTPKHAQYPTETFQLQTTKSPLPWCLILWSTLKPKLLKLGCAWHNMISRTLSKGHQFWVWSAPSGVLVRGTSTIQESPHFLTSKYMNVMECQTLGTIHESVCHDLQIMYSRKNKGLISGFVFVYK